MDYSVIEQERLKAYKKFKFYRNLGLLTFIILIGIGFLIYAYHIKKVFYREYKQKLISPILNEKYPGAIYHPEMGLPYELIRSTGMYTQRADRYRSEDLIQGEYKGVSFEVSDVLMEERQVTRDFQGHTQVRYVQFYKGRWYVFKYSKSLNQIIKIKEATLFASVDTKGLEKAEVESIAFNKKFKMYTSDPKTVFYVLTPVLIEKFLEIEKLHNGRICFAFINDQLHIGINDGKNYLEPKFRKPIDDQVINELLGQIDIIGAVINEFKLDSVKFKKE